MTQAEKHLTILFLWHFLYSKVLHRIHYHPSCSWPWTTPVLPKHNSSWTTGVLISVACGCNETLHTPLWPAPRQENTAGITTDGAARSPLCRKRESSGLLTSSGRRNCCTRSLMNKVTGESSVTQHTHTNKPIKLSRVKVRLHLDSLPPLCGTLVASTPLEVSCLLSSLL